MPEMTLRQIEVIRAVMMTGTISGAADMLNVSSPGISRLVKHTEESLGLRLFERKAGLFVPSVEASRVFDQVREVYRGVENLQQAVGNLQKGEDGWLLPRRRPSRNSSLPVFFALSAVNMPTFSSTSIFSRSKKLWTTCFWNAANLSL